MNTLGNYNYIEVKLLPNTEEMDEKQKQEYTDFMEMVSHFNSKMLKVNFKKSESWDENDTEK